ncbi:MAG: 30S ribosomal protein S6 [Flavobacteriales bacterium]|nr:MAG: 30S ribosomal protein S6 [Flavobacteriales bacterium]
MQKICSSGKLLLTSEYFVLDGALALAVPTKLGQAFFCEEINDSKSLISWEAQHLEQDWLKVIIDYQKWEILSTNLPEAGDFVLKVLQEVQRLSPLKLQNKTSYSIKTNLEFPSNYGLGSSSTLMNNLAQWANIDAFLLNEKTLGGSGYDIAVAQENSAILYQTQPERKVQKVKFNPSFKDELIFIHLNQKQDSREGIQHYKALPKNEKLIEEFSAITRQIVEAGDIDEFSKLMTEHETKVSNALQLETVKEKYFSDYGGFVKSLGAWGGDFVLASKFGDFKTYFKDKKFSTILNWSDLID